ncbi:hypothetical protein ABE332_07270 [Bacillus licheniformis]|uniref:hypothetical protein n=1 Tax=Bacillus licheniformis TaxID=1402 RepID=UPI002E203847|nr:hypothetical protein [Bacillus licheniformis]
MDRKKSKLNWDFVFLFILFSLILVDLLIFAGVIKSFFGKIDTTLYSACIAFIGAIIGGGITYYGVKKTIKANEDLNYKNELPEKILSIEEVINNVREVYEKQIPIMKIRIREEGRAFFYIGKKDGEVRLIVGSLYNPLMRENLDGYKNKLIFVDGEAFKIFLDFKEKLQNIEWYSREAEDLVFDYAKFEYPDLENAINNNEPTAEHENRLGNLEKSISDLESRFKNELIQLYKEFHYQLVSKQTRLLDQLRGPLY